MKGFQVGDLVRFIGHSRILGVPEPCFATVKTVAGKAIVVDRDPDPAKNDRYWHEDYWELESRPKPLVERVAQLEAEVERLSRLVESLLLTGLPL